MREPRSERAVSARGGRGPAVRVVAAVAGVAAVALAVPVMLTVTPPAAEPAVAAPSALTVTRVAGTDRYTTAAAIATAGWPAKLPPGSTVLLATGASYPDAVAGAAAAGHLGVPLLLSTGATLSPSAADEIARLKPATVALVGGTTSLSDAVAAAVRALGPQVVRWQGDSRYATAAAISKAVYPNGATNAYLANGRSFADALTAAALAGAAGGPLLLTEPGELPQATVDELSRLHPSAVVVIGGASSVSAAVAEKAVEAAGGAQRSRIQGSGRYDTADAIAGVLVGVHGGATASEGALLAAGTGFADALAGAAWAGASGRPLLLSPGTSVRPHTWQTMQTLQVRSVTLLGGPGAISAQVAGGLSAGAPPT